MSGVSRYDVTEGGGLWKCDGGELVFYSDYDTLRTANQRLETELADANEKIDKAWNLSHQLDSGAYIPGALDAWKRPVLQRLPYETFGKRDINTSQYCNGWNDAGGYWKAHADDLTAANQRLEQEVGKLKAVMANQSARQFVGHDDQRHIDDLVAAGIRASDAEMKRLEGEVARLRADSERWKAVETAGGELTLRLHNSRPDRRAAIIDAALGGKGGVSECLK